MNKKIRLFLSITIIGSVFLTACVNKENKSTSSTTTISYESQVLKEKPGIKDDFYTNINYDYLKNTKIPTGESSNGVFDDLDRKTKVDLKKIIEDLNKNYDNLKENSDEKKIVDLYNLLKDTKKREELGLKPIEDTLKQIKNAKSISDINKFILDNMNKGYFVFSIPTVTQNLQNSSINSLFIGVNSSLGIEKNYFEGSDDFSKKVQKAYKEYLKELFVNIGYSEDEAKKKAENTYNIEKEITSSTLSPEEKMNISNMNNVVSINELLKITSNMNYGEILKSKKFENVESVTIPELKALKKINSLFVDKNVEVLKDLIEVNVLKQNSQLLTKKIQSAYEKYNSIYTGITETKTDDEIAFELTNMTLSMPLGKLYVEKYFDQKSKSDVQNITKEILDTYKKRVKNVDWMTSETKQKALKKLDNLNMKIGYPDKWKDYSDVTVKPYSKGGTATSAMESIVNKQLNENNDKIGKTPDKDEWGMAPQVINAYYDPTKNEIVFTAAILQAPFYSEDQSREKNLGGIGSVIGHEISHSLDVMGSQFDENGNLSNWWKEEDLTKFQNKVKQAADIYSKIEVVDGYKINGEISTGEIMADLGGMTVAIDIAKKENLDTKKVFESYALSNAHVSTKESIISNLTDEHPPEKYRVNNIINLIDQFYVDYDIKENDKMYVKPEDRLKVW